LFEIEQQRYYGVMKNKTLKSCQNFLMRFL
jgi:hypothetical protein